MWGEIDPPQKTLLNTCEKNDDTETSDSTNVHLEPRMVLVPAYALTKPTTCAIDIPQEDKQVVSPTVNAMLDAIASSGSQVKSQQIGEADLTLDQRREELLQQYRSRPLVFLERYQAHLRPQHLSAFSHLASDPRAQHYCGVIQRRPCGHADRTRVRNQRYAALRVLQRDGQYFSEEQMRIREPLLYEQYIGQYLTDDEILERSQESMQETAAQGDGPEGCMSGGLAHILLNSYQERLLQSRLEEEQEKEDGAKEEEEDDEDYNDHGGEGRQWEPTPEEKVLLREEFISQMHQRFLSGKDKDFNYSEVDENPDYDNLDIVSRDEEEKYFDDDEEEQEEEEEEEEEQQMKNEEDGEEESMTE